MPETTFPAPLLRHRWLALSLAAVLALLIADISIPNLLRTRLAVPYDTAAPVGYVTDKLFNSSRESERQFSRKVVRTGTLELEVKSPAEAAENIRLLAERLGGYLVSSQISGAENMPAATITIRVPVARFDEARTEIKKLAARVAMEKTNASDVTREYVDQDARLRNLRATESQYLAIMKRATTVKDTLAVSEKLSDVRSQIEQQQAEFDALSKQIETVAINVSMRALADTRVFGLHWRPWYQLKVAMRDGLDGLGNYAATMAAVIMYLPAIILWIVTVLIGAAILWRIFRWAARLFFALPKTISSEKVIS